VEARILEEKRVEIELYIDGEGPAFVILPSYGRGISADFDAITARVVEAGWTVLRPQPRGIAGSKGPMTRTPVSRAVGITQRKRSR